MAMNLRQDERQWLRYAPDELVATMRAAEAWSLRVGGAFLTQRADLLGSVEAAQNARMIGDVMMRISDARMDLLASETYETSLEETVAGSSFDVLSRVLAGEAVASEVVVAATDALLASLHHIDQRTMEAGFLHPTRLESVLTRGDT